MHIFNPKNLIMDPFDACPRCQMHEFGVITVDGNSYSKKCRNCMYYQQYALPKLTKRVIYLDQFVFSNMLKVLTARGAQHQDNSRYIELFHRLNRLCRLQVIVCPQSDIHFDESFVTPEYYKQENRLHEQLAGGTKFENVNNVKSSQICRNFARTLGEDEGFLDVRSVVHGKLDQWSSRLLIHAAIPDISEIREGIEATRDAAGEKLNDLFMLWQSNHNFSFDEHFSVEATSVGPTIWRCYKEAVRRDYENIMRGELAYSSMIAFPSSIVTMLENYALDHGHEGDSLQKVVNYLMSDDLKQLPFNALSCMMWASLAQEASAGRKKVPSRGMFNDINALAVYAPYCDAMFVDKECWRLVMSKGSKLKEGIKSQYNLTDKIFSLSNLGSFLQFLESVEESVIEEHLTLVNEVYGDSWQQPFTSMFSVV